MPFRNPAFLAICGLRARTGALYVIPSDILQGSVRSRRFGHGDHERKVATQGHPLSRGSNRPQPAAAKSAVVAWCRKAIDTIATAITKRRSRCSSRPSRSFRTCRSSGSTRATPAGKSWCPARRRRRATAAAKCAKDSLTRYRSLAPQDPRGEHALRPDALRQRRVRGAVQDVRGAVPEEPARRRGDQRPHPGLLEVEQAGRDAGVVRPQGRAAEQRRRGAIRGRRVHLQPALPEGRRTREVLARSPT